MNKILVVDDDPAIVEAIQLALEDDGYSVETCIDGEKGLELIATLKPKVVLLDLLLSGKDGGEIIIKLKQSDETKDIPVILVSAHPSAEEISKKSGANDFLAKPFDVEVLLEIIKKHMGNK